MCDGSETERTAASNKKNSYVVRLLWIYLAVAVIAAVTYTAYLNKTIFTLSDDTLGAVTQFYNVMVLLLIPFVLGCVGGCARILLSGNSVSRSFRTIFASGMMASFSWLSIKSKVFISLVAPYVVHEQQGSSVGQAVANAGSEFYSLALVAVLVGMFSSNIYIAINERVERATRNQQSDNSQGK